MNTHNYYAFYGSLRRSMPLYNQFESSMDYCYSAWLIGYELYSLGDYPYAVKSSNASSKILVEVFQLSNLEAEKSIHEIELSAGYFISHHRFAGQSLKIFLYEKATNNLRVVSGDWVSFFRQ